MKKVLSLVLVIAMVLSSMSFAFAGTFEDVTGDYEKAIETLVALGVITGYEDGTFRPERVVTRAEMAKLMVVTLGYGDLIAGSKSNFTDTQGHWADAYIALAAGKGIVVGDGDGKFRPDATVSYDEAITMVVRGLGYTDNCNELKGMTWPTNFKVKAAELDITDDVAITSNGADRGGVAQLLFNALESVLVTVTTDGDVTFLNDTVDGEKVDRLLLTRIATPDYDYDVTPEVLDENNKNYGGDIVDLAPYMFQNLDVYLNDADEVVYVRGTNSLIVEGTVDEVKGTVLSVEDLNGKIKDIDLVSGTAISADEVFENGAIRETNKAYSALEGTETIKVVANDLNENGKITANEIVGFVTTEKTAVIRVAQEYVDGKTKLDGLVLPVDDDDEVNLANITVKGDATALEDVKEDDVVVEYLSEDETVTTLVVTRDVVEGKVSRLADADTFYIDGKKFDIADLSIIGDDYFTLGDEGVFFLDHEGKVVDFDGSGVGPTDYAVVINVANGSTDDDRFTGDKSVDEYPSLKVATQDGEEVVYDIEVDVKDDGSIDESAENQANKALVKTGSDTKGNDLIVDTTVVDKDFLIQYKLNKDGRISEIKVVKDLDGYSFPEIDLDKTTNAFAKDAVVFDAGDDYAVVSESKLPTKVESYVVRNTNGEIEVLVAKSGEVDSAAETVFVYIYDADKAYDENSDEVQYVAVYTDNADSGVYTTDKGIVTLPSAGEGVYAVTYDGDAIDEATLVTTTSGILADGEVISGKATTVNAKGNMIEIAGEWYVMSENGTVVSIVDGEEDGLADLYDITKNVSDLVVYVNADGDIDLILIVK